jgi:hypothetical protein
VLKVILLAAASLSSERQGALPNRPKTSKS